MKVLDVLVRKDLLIDQLDAATGFYTRLLDAPVGLDLNLLDGQLRIVGIGRMLLVACHPRIRPSIPAADAAYLVSGIDAFHSTLCAMGCRVVVPLSEVVTGRAMVIEHPDGLVVEYVEHRPRDAASGPGEHQ